MESSSSLRHKQAEQANRTVKRYILNFRDPQFSWLYPLWVNRLTTREWSYQPIKAHRTCLRCKQKEQEGLADWTVKRGLLSFIDSAQLGYLYFFWTVQLTFK